MISLLTTAKAQKALAQNLQEQRVGMGFTQEGLAKRSGVPLATLRKFEQKSLISLESFLKLAMSLGLLEAIVKATQQKSIEFSSIDELIQEGQTAQTQKRIRKKGWRR